MVGRGRKGRYFFDTRIFYFYMSFPSSCFYQKLKEIPPISFVAYSINSFNGKLTINDDRYSSNPLIFCINVSENNAYLVFSFSRHCYHHFLCTTFFCPEEQFIHYSSILLFSFFPFPFFPAFHPSQKTQKSVKKIMEI